MTKVLWLAVGFMIVLGTPPAFADLVMQFSFDGATISVDGTTQTVTTSGGASTSGIVFTFGAFPPGSINISSGLVVSPTGTTGGFMLGGDFVGSNSPASPCCAFPTLKFDTFTMTNQSGATGTLTITVGDTGFTLSTGLSPTLTSSVTANGSNVTVGFTNFFDPTNAQFGGQSLFSGSMNLGAAEQTIVNTTPVSVGTTPFSLADVYTFTMANGDSLSAIITSNTVTTVPEPSTWLLLGANLAGLAGWRSLRPRRLAT